jgi:hypothetical protein
MFSTTTSTRVSPLRTTRGGDDGRRYFGRARSVAVAAFGGGRCVDGVENKMIMKRTPRETRRRHRRVVTVNAVAVIPEAAFTIATASVMPLYAAMIAFPRSEKVFKLVSSKSTFWLLGACYLAAAYASFTSTDVFEAVRRVIMNPGEGMLHKSVSLVSGFLATAETASSAWVHLLALDLFVARFVYMDSAQWSASVGDLVARVPVRHSLVLCCMFGPLGLMSHAVTRWFWNTFVTTDIV